MSVAVANCVQLGVQAAFGASNMSGNRPFFKRLTAARCALRCVASIITRSGLPPLCANAANLVEHPQAASTDKPIVDRLVWTISRRGVAPEKPILDRKHDRDHDPRSSTRAIPCE